jgi:hypothetical protein
MLDAIEFGKSMGRIVNDAIAPLQKTILQLRERVASLEATEPARGEPGEPGQPGKDAAPVSDEQIARAVKMYLFENPPARGEPGAKGDPGQDADPVPLREVVRELLESEELKSLVELRTKEAVSSLPAPKNGLPGKDAPEVTQEKISESVTRYLRENPPPRGEPGVKGDPGVDGIGMAGAMIDRDGALIITTTKGDAVRLGQVVGKDGEDGLGFEDMEASYNGERGVTLKFSRGDQTKEFNFRLPVVIDRGYWREGFKASQGDAVTHDGTLWIALRDNAVKPCLESKDDWRIGARKGRDGRNGKNGIDAPSIIKMGAKDGA